MTVTKIFDNTIKVTPKQKAQDMLYAIIHTKVDYWSENRDNTEGMTEKEIAQVQDQMNKIARRLYKLL